MSYKQLKAFILLLVCLYIVESEAQLQVGFYQSSCGLAELIVKQEVRIGFIKDKGVAAGLVRLHFHDCFVRVRNYTYKHHKHLHTNLRS